MSKWNHHVCFDCWNKLCEERGQPGREPVRVRDDENVCCSCGIRSISGIYVRGKSEDFACKGEGEAHPADDE